MMIYYNGLKKALELEYVVHVIVPKKIARRITILAAEMKRDEER